MSVLSTVLDSFNSLLRVKKGGLELTKKVVEEKKCSEVVTNQQYSLFVGKWILFSFINYENRKGYDGKMIFFSYIYYL